MLRLKTFPINDADAANEFCKENPPRNVEGQSGVMFHDGNIVVVYDDGVVNPLQKRAAILALIESEEQKKFVTEHDLGQNKISLAKITPEGYTVGMSLQAFNALQGIADAEAANSTYSQIQQTEQNIAMQTYELDRITNSLASYQEMLNTYAIQK